MTNNETAEELVEDLGIKIGTPEEALWTKVVEARERQIYNLREALEVEEVFLISAQNKLEKVKSLIN